MRIPPEEAQQTGRSVVGRLGIESGRERAEMILADRTRFVLDRAAWDEFTAALDRPAQADPRVVKLMRRSRPE